MLKSKDCYSNKETYEYHRFMELATVRSYALSPNKLTQIKFLLNNDTVKDLNAEPRFIISTPDGRSRAFYYSGAKLILNFIKTIRTMDSGSLNMEGGALSFFIKPGGVFAITTIAAGEDVRIIESKGIPKRLLKTRPNYIREEFNLSLDRFGEIVQSFIDIVDGKESNTPIHFEQGDTVLYPLHNEYKSVNSSMYLKLSWSYLGRLNIIQLGNGDTTCSLYSLCKEGSAQLPEITEGFIGGIKELVAEFDKTPYGELDSFCKAIPVTLTEDRKPFMEYVGGRGISATDHGGERRVLMLNINSDSLPRTSKVMFHFDNKFFNDLIDGLRFLYNYEIK